MRLITTFFALWLLTTTSWAQEIPAKKEYKHNVATDKMSNYEGSPAAYMPEAKYKGIEKKSLYLPMRDGIVLAIDVYLPRNRKKGEKLPTILHQTRYWRAPKLKFPFSIFSNGLLGRTGAMVKRFLEQGYAIVNVDVRGSGASLGVQQHPWTADEVRDGAEIMDWIIKQEWSDGKIGSLGVSYSGTASEFLATNRHPNLKAVAIMFALFDVYEDNAFPGGVHNAWFTESWGKANDAMDANQLPENYKSLKAFIKGVAMVKTKGRKKMLREAICDHTENKNVHDGALTVDCRDDRPVGGYIESINSFSPHNWVKTLDSSNVAVYSYSGWHDGAYQHAAIKRHNNLHRNPDNKLILGPWEHGGAYNISPYSRAMAGFDHSSELLKFFDLHLKGINTSAKTEPRVHYFTMGMERWQSNATFPPDYVKETTFYLQDGQLNSTFVAEIANTDTILVDNLFGSGDQTRWKAVNGKIKSPFTYSDWTTRSAKLIHYESAPLSQNMEVTGHPIISLPIAASTPDGSIFVYLEEVAPDGTVYHVTEGVLRLSHHATNKNINIYADATPNRTHLRQDVQNLNNDKFTTIALDLLPVSYQFKKGNRFRISIAGADKDHFEFINPLGYQLFIRHDAEHKPQISLPVRFSND
jgi:uncharacterized protein